MMKPFSPVPPLPVEKDNVKTAANGVTDNGQICCNICGHTTFKPFGTRPQWVCCHCNARDRTRLLWLYISRLDLTPQTRILHIAPEKCIYDALVKRVGFSWYETADIDPDRFPFAHNIRQLDLCRLEELPTNYYELIIHSHVLEHIHCDVADTIAHLHRALTPDGIHLCIIPFLKGNYDECFDEIGGAERARRFGHSDHVRRFGRDNLDQHLGAILDIDPNFDATADFTEKRLRQSNIPEVVWQGLTPETVLCLRKGDLK